MLTPRKSKLILVVLSVLVSSCNTSNSGRSYVAAAPGESRIDPQNWPYQPAVMVRDAEMEKRISELMARMTLEEKVGQIMQAAI